MTGRILIRSIGVWMRNVLYFVMPPLAHLNALMKLSAEQQEAEAHPQEPAIERAAVAGQSLEYPYAWNPAANIISTTTLPDVDAPTVVCFVSGVEGIAMRLYADRDDLALYALMFDLEVPKATNASGRQHLINIGRILRWSPDQAKALRAMRDYLCYPPFSWLFDRTKEALS